MHAKQFTHTHKWQQQQQQDAHIPYHTFNSSSATDQCVCVHQLIFVPPSVRPSQHHSVPVTDTYLDAAAAAARDDGG